MFNHFYSERDKLYIIYKAGLLHLLYQNFLECSGPSELAKTFKGRKHYYTKMDMIENSYLKRTFLINKKALK